MSTVHERSECATRAASAERVSVANAPRERSGDLGPPRVSVQGSPRGEAPR